MLELPSLLLASLLKLSDLPSRERASLDLLSFDRLPPPPAEEPSSGAAVADAKRPAVEDCGAPSSVDGAAGDESLEPHDVSAMAAAPAAIAAKVRIVRIFTEVSLLV